MGAHYFRLRNPVGRAGLVILAAAAIVWPAFTSPAAARGPEGIADVAEQVIDAVVNVSTKQSVDLRSGGAMPQLPPGSPFEEFFEEFFKNRRGQPGQPGQNGQNGQNNQTPTPRRVNSLGSGFIVDAAGLVVTNNHVIADADEVNVILNDGTTLKAEVIGRDQRTDLALLKVKPTKPLKAVNSATATDCGSVNGLSPLATRLVWAERLPPASFRPATATSKVDRTIITFRQTPRLIAAIRADRCLT